MYPLRSDLYGSQGVEKLAEAKVGTADTQPSQRLLFRSKAAQMACEVGFLHRRLSFADVQSQARLLLTIYLVGELHTVIALGIHYKFLTG